MEVQGWDGAYFLLLFSATTRTATSQGSGEEVYVGMVLSICSEKWHQMGNGVPLMLH